MVQTIIIAKKTNTRPSEILGIDYPYLAYMVDEFSLFLESQVTDDKGKVNWDRIKTKSENGKVVKDNSEFMEHIKEQRR